MKLVVAIEGMDGSGKSSLALFMQKLCERFGQPCTLVARRGDLASGTVRKLTRFLYDEVRNLVPPADIFLRMGRDYQRAHLVAQAPPGLVVLDRFVLSILALARLNGLDPALLAPLLREIALRAELHATIFVRCPFEVAGSRVSERNPASSSRTLRSERLLRRMAAFMEEDFQSGLLTGQQWLVDNSGTLTDAEDQLADYLLPYLAKRPRGQGSGVRDQESGVRDQESGVRSQFPEADC